MYDRYMKFIDRGVVRGCGSQFKVWIGPSGVARLDLIAVVYKGKLYEIIHRNFKVQIGAFGSDSSILFSSG